MAGKARGRYVPSVGYRSLFHRVSHGKPMKYAECSAVLKGISSLVLCLVDGFVVWCTGYGKSPRIGVSLHSRAISPLV